MRPCAALRVLQRRWGLPPGESQAAEYAAIAGVDRLRRQWRGDTRTLRKIERRLAKGDSP